MEARQLRIGNLVHRFDIGDGSQRTERVLELNSDKALCSGPFPVLMLYEDLQPIPLTEEWLLKFEFEKQSFTISDSKVYEHNSKIRIFHRRDETFALSKDGMQSYVIKSDIKYVHQLQNLYFALTGEELTLK